MRTVVFDRDVAELDIKPESLLGEYRRLLEAESRDLVTQALTDVACPGCRSERHNSAFDKFGFTYRRCPDCETVFVSPRPVQEALDGFYRHGRAAAYWRQRIQKETADSRRMKIVRPRARWILDVIDKHRPSAANAVSVGYHHQLLMEEIRRLEPELFSVTVASAIADLEFQGKNLPGVRLHTGPLAAAFEGPADVILLLDIIDRVADPEAFFRLIAEHLIPGGIVLANTTLISGFDLQVLGERSPSIYPPERLNLFSVEGMQKLFARHGFQVLEFSTPGTFDVEIVRRHVLETPDADWPPFIRYLMRHRDDDTRHDLQGYLQRHLLSSFGRFALKRPDTAS